MEQGKWHIKHFSELSTIELYGIIQLRIEVFIIEQNCPYQDTDDKDLDAYHIWFETKENKILATARILKKGVSYAEVAIGRVCTSPLGRGKNLGKDLMTNSINFVKEELKETEIRISAQTYLLKFYGDLGFVATGKEYLEDDIPHAEMLYS